MNYEPTVWMRCPYDLELCGMDATFTVESISPEGVAGLLECVNGHRWRIERLADSEVSR